MNRTIKQLITAAAVAAALSTGAIAMGAGTAAAETCLEHPTWGKPGAPPPGWDNQAPSSCKHDGPAGHASPHHSLRG